MLLIILLAVGITFAVVSALEWGWDKRFNSWTCAVAGTGILIGASIATGMLFQNSRVDSNNMEVFYQTNVANYEITTDRMESYLSTDKFVDVLVSGSVEKFQVTDPIYESIKEWRDEVNDYNNTLKHWRWLGNKFLMPVVKRPSDNLKYLTIK